MSQTKHDPLLQQMNDDQMKIFNESAKQGDDNKQDQILVREFKIDNQKNINNVIIDENFQNRSQSFHQQILRQSYLKPNKIEKRKQSCQVVQFYKANQYSQRKNRQSTDSQSSQNLKQIIINKTQTLNLKPSINENKSIQKTSRKEVLHQDEKISFIVNSNIQVVQNMKVRQRSYKSKRKNKVQKNKKEKSKLVLTPLTLKNIRNSSVLNRSHSEIAFDEEQKANSARNQNYENLFSKMILTPIVSMAHENKKLEFQKSIAFKSSETNVMQSARMFKSKFKIQDSQNNQTKNEDEISSCSSHSQKIEFKYQKSNTIQEETYKSSQKSNQGWVYLHDQTLVNQQEYLKLKQQKYSIRSSQNSQKQQVNINFNKQIQKHLEVQEIEEDEDNDQLNEQINKIENLIQKQENKIIHVSKIAKKFIEEIELNREVQYRKSIQNVKMFKDMLDEFESKNENVYNFETLQDEQLKFQDQQKDINQIDQSQQKQTIFQNFKEYLANIQKFLAKQKQGQQNKKLNIEDDLSDDLEVHKEFGDSEMKNEICSVSKPRVTMTPSKPKNKAFDFQNSLDNQNNYKPLFINKSDEITNEMTDSEYLNNQNNIAINILNMIKKQTDQRNYLLLELSKIKKLIRKNQFLK